VGVAGTISASRNDNAAVKKGIHREEKRDSSSAAADSE
jgi:hypothetical protein